MADISDINAAQTAKLVGASSDGTEQTPVKSSTAGSLQTIEVDDNGRKAFNYVSGEKAVAARILGQNSTNIMEVNTEGSAQVKLDPVPLFDVVYKDINLRNTAGSKLMAVNGSSTQQIYSFTPGASETWFVESVCLFIQDSGTTGPNEFGANGGLFGQTVSMTNGLVLEVRSKGVVYEVCNVSDNIDLALRFMSSYSQGSGAAWFNNNDTWLGEMKLLKPIRLNGADGDYIRFRVRDNLSSIDYLQTTVKVWRKI